MGNRVSISFRNGDEESVALFSHWDGMSLVDKAKKYVQKLHRERKAGTVLMPLDRMEPRTVMVDFIRHMTKNMGTIDSNYYLGVDDSDGDNGDNGHHTISLEREENP
jgi:hypothetical protein